MINTILKFLSKRFDCIDYFVAGEYLDGSGDGRYKTGYFRKYYIKKKGYTYQFKDGKVIRRKK